MFELYGWPYWHLEKSGKGRAIAHRLEGPWLFEGEEVFAELGGMKQKVQIGDFTDFGRALVIDGMTQLPGGDLEGVYTSALIFPAAISAPSRRRLADCWGRGRACAARGLELSRHRACEARRHLADGDPRDPAVDSQFLGRAPGRSAARDRDARRIRGHARDG